MEARACYGHLEDCEDDEDGVDHDVARRDPVRRAVLTDLPQSGGGWGRTRERKKRGQNI